MSKIVILLLAVLVVSGVAGSALEDDLQSLQNRVESYLTTEIDKIEAKYNTTKPIIKENSGLIYNKDENSVYANACDNVYAILSKAQKEASELIRQMKNTSGIRDCHEIAGYLTYKAEVFLSHVSSCNDYILDTADTLISDMQTTYERLQSNLIDRRNQLAACYRIFSLHTEEVAKAISCTEAIEYAAKSFIAESVPPVVVKIDTTNNILSALTSFLEKCSYRYAAFQREAADLTTRANSCYQQKIDEAAQRPEPTQ